MKLSKILKNVNFTSDDDLNLEITNLSIDSNNLSKGGLFFCINGLNVDGHNFAKQAVEKGASAIVVEHKLDLDIPQIVVKNTRHAVGLCAENFYDHPRDKIKLVGITGTNGKTTTTYMIKNILEMAGHRVGVIGTISVMIGQEKHPATLTTPDSIELHKIFRQMVDSGVDTVVMEVSAHAIALDKMAGVVCDVGVLTNVTQDHLDFFKTFENYANTKQSFISSKFCKIGVVNVDDKVGLDLVLNKNKDIEVKSYGLKEPADCFATNIKYSLNGTTFFLNDEDNLQAINTRLIGEFNVYNALAAATACDCLDVPQTAIKMGLSTMDFVPGRFNVMKLPNGAYVVIDYAHTPDGLSNILSSVRKVCSGKVYSLFGCGGNRDTGKRPIMGKISGELADFTVITSDNPRFEDPDMIVKDVEAGIKDITNQYICITNRKKAINYVLGRLDKGDVAVIAGKGAEDYLDIKGKKIPYSDSETVKTEYQKLQIEAVK